jgi:transmembrane sensor
MADSYVHIDELIVKLLKQDLTEAELVILNQWIEADPAHQLLFDRIHNTTIINEALAKMYSYDEERGWAMVSSELSVVSGESEVGSGEEVVNGEENGQWSMGNSQPGEDAGLRTMDDGQRSDKVRKIWKRVAVAAGIVGILFVAGYYLVTKYEVRGTDSEQIATKTDDVQAPEKNRASITLADGRIVYLDSSGNGQLAMVNGVKVSKTGDGKIEYNGQLATGNGQIVYNTLSNPRGSKVIDMTLSDGSRVWLNAGSSITYPVVFVGSERRVNITGEGYFEVSQQSTDDGQRKKFIVESGTVEVEVLGTHFNVNAYDDEREAKVTLLEGSVKVQSSVDSRQSSILKPGEQARATVDGQLAMSKDVDVEQVIAWKNNEFIFEDDDLNSIMRQLSYWYDIDVQFNGGSSTNYSGRITRDASISKVLKMFEKLGYVKFEIEGKKIKVINVK